MSHPASRVPPEGLIVALMALVQFVNILDGMMVMPMGPDFARSLGIPLSHVGWLSAGYTGSAALVGIAAARFIDRHDRRPALLAAVVGLALATASGALAVDLTTLVGARVLAGACGGPAAALAMAVVADVVPVERRGRAMGLVMGAFALASVLGVPVGLKLAEWGGWRLPFVSVAGVTLLGAAAIARWMPSLRGHIGHEGFTQRAVGQLLEDPVVRLALVATALNLGAVMVVVPNLSGFFQFNMGYRREGLSLLYLVGGLVNLAVMQIAGRWYDKLGAQVLVGVGTALMCGNLLAVFVLGWTWLPVLSVFVAFMVSNGLRMVPLNALYTRVPPPQLRAAFMSLNSSAHHVASALGALVGSALLSEAADGRLVGMHDLAIAAIVLSVAGGLTAIAVERRLRARSA